MKSSSRLLFPWDLAVFPPQLVSKHPQLWCHRETSFCKDSASVPPKASCYFTLRFTLQKRPLMMPFIPPLPNRYGCLCAPRVPIPSTSVCIKKVGRLPVPTSSQYLWSRCGSDLPQPFSICCSILFSCKATGFLFSWLLISSPYKKSGLISLPLLLTILFYTKTEEGGGNFRQNFKIFLSIWKPQNSPWLWVFLAKFPLKILVSINYL